MALWYVERFAESTAEASRPYARTLMSDDAPGSKIDDANLKLPRNLGQRNVVERSHIRREAHEYRTVMGDVAEAMVAVGGGKGAYAAGTAMTGLGKPAAWLPTRNVHMVRIYSGQLCNFRDHAVWGWIRRETKQV